LDAESGGVGLRPDHGVRWLGDRKEIEDQDRDMGKAVVDRTAELSSWVDFCYQIMKARGADLRLREQPLSRPRPRDHCEIY
jgi:hypothetical protein